MARRGLAVLASAWVLWTQTRTSPPDRPPTDAWDVVETFATQAECESARLVVDPPAPEPRGEPGAPFRTRRVCFPDTLDPAATP